MEQRTPQVISAGYLLFRKTPPARFYDQGVSQKSTLPGGDSKPPRMQFLMMQHADRWDLPKGHVDPGESLQQTAIRELFEETAIPITSVWTDPQFQFVEFYEIQNRRKATRLKQLVIFLGWLKDNSPISLTEHIGYEWFDWQPPHSIQPKTINPLLQQVSSHLESISNWPYHSCGIALAQ